jgi:hypothetical protein
VGADASAERVKVLAELSDKFGKNLRDYQMANAADFIEARRMLAETIVRLKGTGADVTVSRKQAGERKRN